MRLLNVLGITLFVTLPLNTEAFEFIDTLLESKEQAIFKAIKKEENLRPHYTYESQIANTVRKTQCLRVPHGAHKGIRNSKLRPFKWVIDIPREGGNNPRDLEKIVKLNALVEVNLLSKEAIIAPIQGVDTAVNRYRLTHKGWAASTGKKNSGACFDLGKVQYLSVTSVENKEIRVSSSEKVTVDVAIVIVGFAPDHAIPEWASHPAIRKAFPIVTKLVEGEKKTLYMNQVNGQWREYLPPRSIKRMQKSGRGRSSTYVEPATSLADRKIFVDALHGPVYKERLSGNWGCIELPSNPSSKTGRVDNDLTNDNSRKYQVAIYDNQNRGAWDTAETITRPLLKRLESAGLLTSSYDASIPGRSNGKNVHNSGIIFALSPNYLHIIDKKRGCISLGSAEIEIIDIKVVDGGDNGTWARPDSARYKFIAKYPDPPAWAKDPVLQVWWPDLKNALKHGRACEGNIAVDLNDKRGFREGPISSCWWAFNSVGFI